MLCIRYKNFYYYCNQYFEFNNQLYLNSLFDRNDI